MGKMELLNEKFVWEDSILILTTILVTIANFGFFFYFKCEFV